MKLDREEDRKFLLAIIAEANFKGASVMVLADLVNRIQNAGIETTKPHVVETDSAA